MVLLLIATLLIMGITAFQATQGMFSALLTLVLTVICLTVAFNYYQPLAVTLYDTMPAYAEAGALLALFVIPLLVLRNLADWLIRGDVTVGSDLVGVWLGRAVAGLFGLFTAILLVGVLTVVMQLLPWGASVLGYRPFDGALQRNQSLWPFCPDRVTVALAEGLSGGSLSGRRGFARYHDDLLREAFCRRNTAGLHGRVEAPADALQVERIEDVTAQIDDDLPYLDAEEHPILDELDPSKRYLLVTVRVDRSARGEPPEKDDTNRRSEPKIFWRLVGTHFRLRCDSGASYYPLAGTPIAVLDQDGKTLPDLLSKKVYPAERSADIGGWDRTRLAVLARYREPKGERSMHAVRAVWLYALDDMQDKPASVIFRGIAVEPAPEVVEGR
ncbi:MAG: hypothetical protein ACOC8F_02000 [Planctomycetota bacterium]